MREQPDGVSRGTAGLACRHGTRTETAAPTRDLLWSDVEDIYAAILAHPFLSGLADGTLPRESFRHYIVQDAHYLRGYARALRAVRGAGPPSADGHGHVRRARGRGDRRRAGPARGADGELGSCPERPPRSRSPRPPAPTSATCWPRCYGGSFAEAVAAVLPCYWIYARVGERAAGPQLTGPALHALDRDVRRRGVPGRRRLGAGAHRPDRRRGSRPPSTALMREHFTTTARYEWMFWDAGYRRETWPVYARAQRRSTGPGSTKCSSAPTTATTIAPRNAGQNPSTSNGSPSPSAMPADQHEQQRVHHEPDQPEGEHVERAADHLDQRLQHRVDQPEDQRNADQRADPAAVVVRAVEVDAGHDQRGHPQADRDHHTRMTEAPSVHQRLGDERAQLGADRDRCSTASAG